MVCAVLILTCRPAHNIIDQMNCHGLLFARFLARWSCTTGQCSVNICCMIEYSDGNNLANEFAHDVYGSSRLFFRVPIGAADAQNCNTRVGFLAHEKEIVLISRCVCNIYRN